MNLLMVLSDLYSYGGSNVMHIVYVWSKIKDLYHPLQTIARYACLDESVI